MFSFSDSLSVAFLLWRLLDFFHALSKLFLLGRKKFHIRERLVSFGKPLSIVIVVDSAYAVDGDVKPKSFVSDCNSLSISCRRCFNTTIYVHNHVTKNDNM